MKENIFTDLYNKVMSFFTSAQATDPTKNIALNRMKTVLMQDRVGFSEHAMQMMREEMLSCIQKYLEIDEESFDLQLEPSESNTTLRLSIPVTRTRDDEEIDKIIQEQAEKQQVKAQELVEELGDIIEERAQEIAQDIAKKEEEISEDEASEEEILENIEESIKTEETEEVKDAVEENLEPQKESKKSLKSKN
jgi:cell division topological specificity factor MinE